MDIHYILDIMNSTAEASSGYAYIKARQDWHNKDNLNLYAFTVIKIDNTIYNTICNAYKENSLFGPVGLTKNLEHYPVYTIQNGLIYYHYKLYISNKD